MDPRPLEVVQALWAAFERSGYEGVLEFMGPDTEWVTREGEVIHGHRELAGFVDEMRRQEISIEPRSFSFEEHGSYVIVAGGLRTRTPSGLSDTHRHWLYHVVDGQIEHIDSLSSRDEALKLIGRGDAAAA